MSIAESTPSSPPLECEAIVNDCAGTSNLLSEADNLELPDISFSDLDQSSSSRILDSSLYKPFDKDGKLRFNLDNTSLDYLNDSSLIDDLGDSDIRNSEQLIGPPLNERDVDIDNLLDIGNDSNLTVSSESRVIEKNVSSLNWILELPKTGETFSSVVNPETAQFNKPSTQLKEKRQRLTVQQKIEIIHRARNGEKLIDIAEQYNTARSTITNIVKNADKLEQAGNEFTNIKASKNLKGSNNQSIEDAVLMWYNQNADLDIPVNGPKIQEKAKELSVKLGNSDFKATNGWLDRFKNRNNITLNRCNRSLKSQKIVSEDDFVAKVLPSLLLEYDQSNIFYGDAFGLLYLLLPEDCVSLIDIRCIAGSMAEERLTAFTALSMNGDKFPLLIVGTEEDSFTTHIKIDYYQNSKSWLTLDIFENWLSKINEWLLKQGRKILLIIPSSPLHEVRVPLDAIKVVYSPDGFKGPIKQGIQISFKRHYRQLLLQNFLTELAFNKVSKISLYYALEYLLLVWHNLSASVIQESFIDSGLSKFDRWTLVPVVSDNVLATDNLELYHSLKYYNYTVPENFHFKDFVSFDNNLQTSCVLSDDDIVFYITKEKNNENRKNKTTLHDNCVKEALQNLNQIVTKIGSEQLSSVFTELSCLIHKKMNQS